MNCILAYDTIKDPRDLAEVIHLAAGFGAEVQLLGKCLDIRSHKTLRRLRSWRPELARDIGRLEVGRFEDVFQWREAVEARRLETIALMVGGGSPPWTLPAPATDPGPGGGADAGPGPGPTRGAGLAFLLGEETHGLSRREAECCRHRWSIPLGEGGRFYTLGQTTAILLGGWKEWEKSWS